jgi:hypothetical protein
LRAVTPPKARVIRLAVRTGSPIRFILNSLS